MSEPDKALQRFLLQFHVEKDDVQFRGETHDVDGNALFANTDNRRIVPEAERKCPICQLEMDTELRDGVKIDVCPAHGVWLDYGELEIICERIDFTRERIVQAKIRDACEKGLAAGRRMGY